MKRITTIIIFLFCAASNYANDHSTAHKIIPIKTNHLLSSLKYIPTKAISPSLTQEPKVFLKRTCKIRVNGESNGNTYDFIIEIEGISWFRCMTIKLADIFTKKY